LQPSQSTPPPAQTNPQYPQNPSQPQRSPLQQAPPPAKNVVEESLEDLRVQYDDAKINSVIIEQVKELIEIDNNLNTKIEDVRSEVDERQKQVKVIDAHYKELKDLEESISEVHSSL